jgi:hypothetical protein
MKNKHAKPLQKTFLVHLAPRRSTRSGGAGLQRGVFCLQSHALYAKFVQQQFLACS